MTGGTADQARPAGTGTLEGQPGAGRPGEGPSGDRRSGGRSGPRTDRRGFLARWTADLSMGARFAAAGGRESWARTIMTAVGVGIGVALLLFAASVPHMASARQTREDGRTITTSMGMKPGPRTIRTIDADTTYHGHDIIGRLMAADGDHPPVPPGTSALPHTGDMLVSPALKRLLDAPDGKLLRERLPYRVVGTIGHEGLVGPHDYLYYAGARHRDLRTDSYRFDHWGNGEANRKLPPELMLLIIVGCVVLLTPVAIFVATAARFGGERRDRRLAALRLVGADGRMTRRIAAGEAMAGALLGLTLGSLLFLLLRQGISKLDMWGFSVFTSDVRPSVGLALLIVLAVPSCAVAVTLFALRSVAIEPLGVVRNTIPRRRRLWWRLALPVLGLALLLPMVGGYSTDTASTYQVAVGAVLILVGTTALLPWLVESVVARWKAGPVSLQLAVRRLQLSSGTAARAVSGITVAVAGAIAIQMLFASVQAEHTNPTGLDTKHVQMDGAFHASHGYAQGQRVIDAFQHTKGVRQVYGFVNSTVSDARHRHGHASDAPTTTLTIGDCGTLREYAHIGHCRDGDVFLVPPKRGAEEPSFSTEPGHPVSVQESHQTWTIPKSARTVAAGNGPYGDPLNGILATPSAAPTAQLGGDLEVGIQLRLDPGVKDAKEYARNTAAQLTPTMYLNDVSSTTEDHAFSSISRALFAGATAILLVIGASMIVSTLEQLRERKRLLSVLVAFGTRRTTLAWSVLWQTAIPVVLGLVVSAAGGLLLGSVLLKMIEESISVDWASLATLTGVSAGVILLVTLVTLGPLWRMMRPDGLRTE